MNTLEILLQRQKERQLFDSEIQLLAELQGSVDQSLLNKGTKASDQPKQPSKEEEKKEAHGGLAMSVAMGDVCQIGVIGGIDGNLMTPW